MRSLVHFMGDFSVDELDKIMPQIKVLANQPSLEVHEVFVGREPEFNRRMILVSQSEMNRYHVIDMGHIKDESSAVPLGSRFYSEGDVEKLRQEFKDETKEMVDRYKLTQA